MNLQKKLVKGFTLIELLVVIAIISILVAVGTSSYQKATRLSRDSKRKADLEQIRQALETYRSENGVYPANITSTLTPTYMTTVPSDPRGTGYTYYYARGGTNITYTLCAKLEVTPATSSCTTQSCGATAGNCNYGTANP